MKPVLRPSSAPFFCLVLGLLLCLGLGPAGAAVAQETAPAAPAPADTSADTPADAPAESPADMLGLNIPVLDRYIQAVAYLQDSVSSLESDPGESLASLVRAENAFRTLANETRSETLRTGLVNTFEQARTAINRRSVTDLRVQTAVIRGGLQRIVYETALVDAVSGNLPLAQDKASRLARDIGFSEERQEAVEVRVGSLAQLLANFEQGVGEHIQARLNEVSELQAGDGEAAYLTLAAAYAAFIPVQDSLQASESATDSFVGAFTALLEDDAETLETQLVQLDQQLAGLAGVTAQTEATEEVPAPEAAETGEAVLTPAPMTTDVPGEAQAADIQATAPQAAAPQAAAPQAEETAEAEAAALEPSAPQPAEAPATETVETETVETEAAATEAAATETVAAEPQPAEAAPAEAEPAATPFRPLPADVAESVDATRAPGEGETEAATEGVAERPTPVPAPVPAAEAQAEGADEAAEVGVPAPAPEDGVLGVPAEEGAAGEGAAGMGPEEARAALERSLEPYRPAGQDLSALADAFGRAGYADLQALTNGLYARAARVVAAVELGLPDEARSLIAGIRAEVEGLVQPLLGADAAQAADVLRHLETAPALRLQDAALVIGEVDRLAAALQAREAGFLQGVNASLGRWWPGFVRAGVVIVLALLAFYPLYLLNLAFGGGNRSWRWIGLALFLLLLPVIYEGASYAGALLAEASGIAALAAPLALSPFQNLLGGFLWVVATALAILFASYGLYGICVQFGLLGKAKAAPAPVASGPEAAKRAPTKVGGERAVDWDDDF